MNPSLEKFLVEGGITNVRQLPTGEWAGLHQFAFTCGLMVGLKEDMFDFYRTRYCYKTRTEALVALLQWDGEGFPPGNWIKQKPEDVLNPKLLEEV